MDDADRADAQEQVFLDLALDAIRHRPLEVVSISGACLNCGEPFSPGEWRRWCDADCRDDWAKRVRR